jgi:hypothetical protein
MEIRISKAGRKVMSLNLTRSATIPSDVGEGWYPIVEQLDRDLAAIDEGYVLCQCKEKFSTLRYYVDSTFDFDSPEFEAMDALIRKAEEKSAITCEFCGKPGTMDNTHYWLKTVCPECLTTRFPNSKTSV